MGLGIKAQAVHQNTPIAAELQIHTWRENTVRQVVACTYRRLKLVWAGKKAGVEHTMLSMEEDVERHYQVGEVADHVCACHVSRPYGALLWNTLRVEYPVPPDRLMKQEKKALSLRSLPFETASVFDLGGCWLAPTVKFSKRQFLGLAALSTVDRNVPLSTKRKTLLASAIEPCPN